MRHTVDFATFCHAGDAHRLHQPGQLTRQVQSNGYDFEQVIVVYQQVAPPDWAYGLSQQPLRHMILDELAIDNTLRIFRVDPNKPQYVSDTDKAHAWRYHVVNHLTAALASNADFIVFADNDCWMVEQPPGQSWVNVGINLLENNRDIFIISPNDGEPERKTLRMSQQMFLTRADEFRKADFTQPGYTGNPNDYDTMPEYHAMLEGRMEYHCRQAGKYRYVLGTEFRYWHFNRLTKNGLLEMDRSKY